MALKRASVLRYSAIQFVVLVAAAMIAYPGGTWDDPFAKRYQLAHNFLSDLGATHTFSGAPNYTSLVLFAIALVTMGGALVAFAWAWPAFAFAQQRARGAGVGSALFGTASGAAFTGLAFAPLDRAIDLHNTLVVAAFGLLLAYVACLTFLMWRNRVGRLAINAGYLAIVGAYFALVLAGPSFSTERGFEIQVVAQKIVVCATMVEIAFVTAVVR